MQNYRLNLSRRARRAEKFVALMPKKVWCTKVGIAVFPDMLCWKGEIFRACPKAPHLWVSRTGIVLTSHFKTGASILFPRPLTVFLDKDGYPRVGCKHKFECNRSMLPVHRLVLECWDAPRPDGLECRHLDGDKKNNCLANLKWGTVKENGTDKKLHGSSRGSRNGAAKMTPAFVKNLRNQYKTISLFKLEQKYPQYSKFALWAAVSGYTWSHLPGAIAKRRRCAKGKKAADGIIPISKTQC